MSRVFTTPFLLAGLSLLALASPVFANSIAPTAYFLPGYLPMMLWLSLPASILAAVLERPFVSRAGVYKYAVWYSLQANLISLAIGFATLPVAASALYTIGPFWSFFAVGLSVMSEGLYYQFRTAKEGSTIRWRWIVAGNIFSSFILLFIPPATRVLKESKPNLEWELAPYHDALYWGTIAVSVIVFVGSFCVPGWLRRIRVATNPSITTIVEQKQSEQ